MLYKDKMTPGTKIIVRSDKPLSDGVTMGSRSDVITHLTMMTSPGAVFSDLNLPILPGEILEIVEKPKKRINGRINSAIVRNHAGVEGHVYWCELRINCHHISGGEK